MTATANSRNLTDDEATRFLEESLKKYGKDEGKSNFFKVIRRDLDGMAKLAVEQDFASSLEEGRNLISNLKNTSFSRVVTGVQLIEKYSFLDRLFNKSPMYEISNFSSGW